MAIDCIHGEGITLRPARREEMPAYNRWFNDFHTMRTQGDPTPAPYTLDTMQPWYDGEMSGNPRRHWFSVYEQATGRHIGFVDLHHIDFRHCTATMSLMVGEPESRGKGYGTEMCRLILAYGIDTLGLHNIMLECYAYNAAGQRAYANAGFREFARRNASHYMGGQWWDIVFMECVGAGTGSMLSH